MAPRPSAYQIFAGLPDGPAHWLEAVYGLEHARRRMQDIAKQQPGFYFIRNLQQAVLCGVSTAPEPSRPQEYRETDYTAKGTAA